MSRGAEAEDAALAYLQGQGLKLRTRNYRSRFGELDLVMDDGDAVVVVEVRQRGNARYGDAAATVDARKQGRIVAAASMLLAEQSALARRPLRFDVVAIDGAGAISWLKNAFDATA